MKNKVVISLILSLFLISIFCYVDMQKVTSSIPETEWIKDLDNPLEIEALGDIAYFTVVHDETKYRMWYQKHGEHGGIIYIDSDDGKIWDSNSYTEIDILPGEGGFDDGFEDFTGWKRLAVGAPTVIYDKTTQLYYMWYKGFESHGGRSARGMNMMKMVTAYPILFLNLENRMG